MTENENTTKQTRVANVALLDACEQWTDLEGLAAKGILATPAELEQLRQADQLVEHEGRWLRDRRALLAARMRAGSIATKEGAPASDFDRENITPGDLDFLVDHGLLNRSATGAISVDLRAEQLLYSSGFRLFVMMALPSAEMPVALEPLAQELLDLVAAGSDWLCADELQASVNAARGAAEHVALGPIETALADLFHASLVEMKDENCARRWREDRDRAVARRSILLAKLGLTLGEGATIENLMGELGQPHDVVDADVGALVDAGLVVLVDDAVKLRVDANGYADIWRFAAAEASHGRDRDEAAIVKPGEIQTLIGEVAGWREKYGTERRRGNDLASWIHRKGFSEQDALDEIRGVTVVAKPKREVFTFTSARTINDAEKGLILGEIIAIDQKIAAVRGELEVLTGEHKTRIKELVKEIEGLKSAAACSQRVIECEAYKVVNWKEGKVRTYRVGDDVLLGEEDIPKGQQRTIETEAKVPGAVIDVEHDGSAGGASLEEALGVLRAGGNAAASAATLMLLPNDELEQVARDAAERGITMQLDLNQTGAARIVSIAGGGKKAEAVVEEAASKLPFPTGEAELAEAVLGTFCDQNLFTFECIQDALEQRYDVPAGCVPRVAHAIDRLVERGAIEAADGGAWKRVGAAEPGPLSLPANTTPAPAPAPEKAKRSRKAKPEARAT